MLPLLQIEVEMLKIKSHVLTLNMLPVPIYIYIYMFFFLLIHTQFRLQQEVIQTQVFSTLIIGLRFFSHPYTQN